MTEDGRNDFALSCPVPLSDHATVQLAHGGGGRLMRALIEGMFLPAFAAAPPLPPGEGRGEGVATAPHDSAVVEINGTRLAFTTDTFVVHPLFFPGGDIGKLAVYGTVNDLAMAGARPLYLSAAFVLEEGLPMETLRRVVEAMRNAAREVGVQIVTGDTKVVDRGKGDGIFVNTAGIGLVPPGIEIAPSRVQPGDAILVSGDLGRHGMAVMSVREGLGFEAALESDCASLAGLVEAMLNVVVRGKGDSPHLPERPGGGHRAGTVVAQMGTVPFSGAEVHCLRDLTRGGLAAALNEISAAAGMGIELEEAAIPVSAPVAAACEVLGLDPLYVANEGRLVAFVAPAAAERVLDIMRGHPAAHGPAVIGHVTAAHPGMVEARGPLGGGRIVDLLSGEQMPRIC